MSAETTSLILDHARSSETVRAGDALAYLTAHGWDAGARENPLNTARSALCYLAQRGDLERLRPGVYRLAPEGCRARPSPSRMTELGRMIGDLEGFIERRAAELAQPLIGKMEHRHAERIASLLSKLGPGYQDLLASIWLYIDWHYVTSQLTTAQKELFADAVDASAARRHDGIGEPSTAERWWRDDA